MFNRVVMLGNLTRDPELRYLPSGGAVATCGIATNRKFKKQDGSAGEEVCFVDITCFGRTAEVVNQYCRRGSKLLVEGRLKLDQWTDGQGVKRSKHSITVESVQMVGEKKEESSNAPASSIPYTAYNKDGSIQEQGELPLPEMNINDDEIPF